MPPRVFAALLLARASWAQVGFIQSDEQRYLDAWGTLTANSYSAVASEAPAALTAECAGKGSAYNGQPANFATHELTGDVSAAQAQAACGRDTVCVVAAGATLRMETNLDVAALVVRGAIMWDDASQTADDQWLCAGYVATEAGGVFNITVHEHRAWVYVKDNSAYHANLTVRAFGGVKSTIELSGRPLRRTWSLLAEPVSADAQSITLLHDPLAMGWAVGDRIMIASTAGQSQGTADSFSISGFGEGNTVQLSGPTTQALRAEFRASGDSGLALLSAEVIHLSRSLVVTGDPFTHVGCSAFSSTASTCTMGLHTIMMGHGGNIRVQHSRVERCGQRGVLGKYCLHMHLISSCPDCLFRGNAVEFGQQRGLVVHGSHLATVAENVFADVRGAGLYVEDGNELFNVLKHNVVVCPHSRWGDMYGCTAPGTDNSEADSSNNQAGMWALPTRNHVVGNRFSNSFNGMFFQANFAGGSGRGAASGLICTESQRLGRIQGNTCHGHGRFGTYLLGPNFPRNTDETVESDGAVGDRGSCAGFTAVGADNGVSTLLSENVDYGNVFVGQYDLGDIQYAHHTALESNNLMYWKTTKNAADGCSAHLRGGLFAGGNVGLPDQAAFLIEGTRFEGDTTLEADHHCDEGVTGVLCSPTYVFVNVEWAVTAARWMYWFQPGANAGASANTLGGLFVLSPPEEANAAGSVFPAGYCALVSGTFSYLAAIDAGASCATAASLGVGTRYSDGVLCSRPLRALRIYTRGLTEATAQRLSVELWQGGTLQSSLLLPYHQIGDDGSTRKQGYALPVATDQAGKTAHEYRIALEGGGALATDWIIEFSDPIFGNRWAADTVTLVVNGRSCGASVSSQHDRAFIWAGVADADHLADGAWGRGACTTQPDLATVNCATQAALALPTCDGCGEAEAAALCSAARCGANGRCTATFLGGDLPVSQSACVCEAPFTGPLCEQDPCAAVAEPCGGHGTCVGTGDSDYSCTCESGHSGRRCEHDCTAVCSGDFPFECNAGGCSPSGACPAPYILCNGGGGCMYVDTLDGVGTDWCPMVAADACDGVVCSKPNDCWLAGPCTNGTCAAATMRPDGSACHSREDGSCLGGECLNGDPSRPPQPPVPAPPMPRAPAQSSALAGAVAGSVVGVLVLLVAGAVVAWRCCRSAGGMRSSVSSTTSSGSGDRPMPMRSKSRAVLQQYAGPKEERKRGTSFVGAFIAPRVSRASFSMEPSGGKNPPSSKGNTPRGSLASGSASVKMPPAPTPPPLPPVTPSLPTGWEEHMTEEGVSYFYDTRSGTTQWERPAPPPRPPGPKPPRPPGSKPDAVTACASVNALRSVKL